MMRMVSEEKDSVLTGLLVAALVFTAVKRSYHGKFVVCVLKAVARQVRCWARLARAKAESCIWIMRYHSRIAYKEGTVFADYYAIVAIRLTA